MAVTSIDQLATTGISGTTGEKPQSKVWEYNNVWWGVWAKFNGTYLHRLDGTTWTSVLKISSSTNAKADVKADGNLAHVLLQSDGNLQLASLQYVAGTLPTYQPWSSRPTLSSVTLPSDTEAATMDIDSKKRMWLAYDNVRNIEVRYSDAPYTTWSGPTVLASNVNDDDIAVVTAMPGKVGVLWSNQTTKRFGFRTHADGAAPTSWSADEVPASQSAQNIGFGMADDHLDVAVAADGTLYAAVKTSYDTAGATQVALLIRRPTGAWDNIYQVDTVGTRPIVQLNANTGDLFYTYHLDTAEPIVYREYTASTRTWGPRKILLNDPTLNNPSSTKQTFTDDVVVISANGSGKLFSARVKFAASSNRAPSVYAGPDKTLSAPGSVTLDGAVSDDGLPNPPGRVTSLWTKISGPGSVTFASSATPRTTATFSALGTYVLRLTASDGALSAFDEVSVVVGTGGKKTVAFRNRSSPTTTYANVWDATIKSGAPTTNFGSAATLEMEGTPDIASLLKWDISAIPAGSIVNSATLTFYVSNASPSTYNIYQMKRAWVESEVTWTRASAGVNWAVAGVQGAADRGTAALGQVTAAATGFANVALNATGISIVQAWVNNPATNFGLIVQQYVDSANNRLYFASNENPTLANRPTLTIAYTPKATLTLLASSETSTARTTSASSPSLPGSPNNSTRETNSANSTRTAMAVDLPRSSSEPPLRRSASTPTFKFDAFDVVESIVASALWTDLASQKRT